MKSIATRNLRWFLVISLAAITAGCTTSTRLVKTEFSVAQPSPSSEIKTVSLVDKNSGNTSGNNSGNNNEITNETSTAINQQDYEHSITRLTPLAEKGQADAQYSLGYMYYNGLGVYRSDALALKWLSAAAKQGNKNAIVALRRIALVNSATALDAEGFTDRAPETALETVLETTPEIKTIPHEEPREIKIQAASAPRLPKAATDEMARSLTLVAQPSLTENEQWIMDQSGERYTIQLVATGNKAAMLRFIDSNNLRDSAVYYKTRRKNNDWYTLIFGSYKTLSAAKKTVKKLTSSLRKTKPWIKPISGIQKALASR